MEMRGESVGEVVMEGDLEESGGYPNQREGRQAGEEEGGVRGVFEEDPRGAKEFEEHEGSDQPRDAGCVLAVKVGKVLGGDVFEEGIVDPLDGVDESDERPRDGGVEGEEGGHGEGW